MHEAKFAAAAPEAGNLRLREWSGAKARSSVRHQEVQRLLPPRHLPVLQLLDTMPDSQGSASCTDGAQNQPRGRERTTQIVRYSTSGQKKTDSCGYIYIYIYI